LVLSAIKEAGRFKEPGTGIAFVLAAEQTAGFESQLSKSHRWQKTILCVLWTIMAFIFDEELFHQVWSGSPFPESIPVSNLIFEFLRIVQILSWAVWNPERRVLNASSPLISVPTSKATAVYSTWYSASNKSRVIFLQTLIIQNVLLRWFTSPWDIHKTTRKDNHFSSWKNSNDWKIDLSRFREKN